MWLYINPAAPAVDSSSSVCWSRFALAGSCLSSAGCTTSPTWGSGTVMPDIHTYKHTHTPITNVWPFRCQHSFIYSTEILFKFNSNNLSGSRLRFRIGTKPTYCLKAARLLDYRLWGSYRCRLSRAAILQVWNCIAQIQKTLLDMISTFSL